jgi:hypothetical protein
VSVEHKHETYVTLIVIFISFDILEYLHFETAVKRHWNQSIKEECDGAENKCSF